MSPIVAMAVQLPQEDGYKHFGVASCSSTQCHGSFKKYNKSHILRNEYRTWAKEDRHSRAYKTLRTKESRRIARNLGLPNAYGAKICLDCHADNVPAQLRGKKFDITDGVGCEACHGGSEKWLKSHTEHDVTHKGNIKNGLYPTDLPRARAELCLSCHFGTKNKFATHRIMGAGHPRLLFELDTFGILQPEHFKIDKDYRERKTVTGDVKLWAMGQVVAAGLAIETLTSSRLKGNGLFPELALFDCQACHHSIYEKHWMKREITGELPPGSIRLNDSSLVMLLAITDIIDAGEYRPLYNNVKKLHEAAMKSREAIADAAGVLLKQLTMLEKRISEHQFSQQNKRALLVMILNNGIDGEYRDFTNAEQTTMALELLANSLKKGDAVGSTLDKLYPLFSGEKQYTPDKFIGLLKKFREQVGLGA